MIGVLVIGGCGFERRQWKHFLQARGYRVYQAATPAEGFRLCGDGPPDLLIMDVDSIMPSSQALATIKAVREDYPEIQILAFSSFLSRKKALEAGADVCIPSPSDDALVLELADTMTGGFVDDINMGVPERRGLRIERDPVLIT